MGNFIGPSRPAGATGELHVQRLVAMHVKWFMVPAGCRHPVSFTCELWLSSGSCPEANNLSPYDRVSDAERRSFQARNINMLRLPELQDSTTISDCSGAHRKTCSLAFLLDSFGATVSWMFEGPLGQQRERSAGHSGSPAQQEYRRGEVSGAGSLFCRSFAKFFISCSILCLSAGARVIHNST